MSYFVWLRHGDSRCQWQRNTTKREERKMGGEKQNTECKGTRDGGWDGKGWGGGLIWKAEEKQREMDTTREESHIPPLRHHPGNKHGWSGMRRVRIKPHKSGGGKLRLSQQNWHEKNQHTHLPKACKRISALSPFTVCVSWGSSADALRTPPV